MQILMTHTIVSEQKHIQFKKETNNDDAHEVAESKVVGLEDENRLLKNEIKELKGKVKIMN